MLVSMHALSETLIEVLQMVVQYGATRIDLTDRSLRLFCGEEIIGDVDAPPGSVETIRGDLRAMGARSASPVELSVQSPLGPLRFTAVVTANVTRLTFPATASEAKAEAIFNEVMMILTKLNGDRVECSPMSAVFYRGGIRLDTAVSLDGRYEPLIEHGRKLGGITRNESTGTAMLMQANGSPQVLRIEVYKETVRFILERR